MDGALLVIAGNESCPQPQTSEHLAAIEIMKLKYKRGTSRQKSIRYLSYLSIDSNQAQ